MTTYYELTCISGQGPEESFYCDIDEAAELSGLHPGVIEEFLRSQLVQGFQGRDGRLLFDHAGVSRLRQIAHLRDREQMSLKVVRYIVTLLDSLDAREAELVELRERLR